MKIGKALGVGTALVPRVVMEQRQRNFADAVNAYIEKKLEEE